jgi:hypothetical protein
LKLNVLNMLTREAKLSSPASVILLAVLTLMMTSPITYASSVSREYSSNAWTISCNLSSESAEPGTSLTLNVEIGAKKTSYDFELWVSPTSPLSVTLEGSQDSHLKYSQLLAGERHLEAFTINVPTTVKDGEIYGININAQSFSSPPLLGAIRLPGIRPDFQIDTSSQPESMFKVTVVTVAVLAVGQASFPNSVARGDTFTVSITLLNTGTGTAKAGSVAISASSGLEVLDVTGFVNGSDVQPRQTVNVVISLRALQEGPQKIDLALTSPNAKPLVQEFQIEVAETPSEQLVGFVQSTTFIVIVVAVIALGALALYVRRERAGY